MTSRTLRDSRGADGAPECPLHDALVQVVAPPAPVGGDMRARGREQVLPAPVDVDVGILPSQRVVDPGDPGVGAPIARGAQGGPRELRAHGQHARSRRRSAAVLTTLASADDDLTPVEVDVLDPQAHALEYPETASIHEHHADPVLLAPPAEDPAHPPLGAYD